MLRKFCKLWLVLLLILGLCLLPSKALAVSGDPCRGQRSAAPSCSAVIRLLTARSGCYFYLMQPEREPSCRPACPSAAQPEAKPEVQPEAKPEVQPEAKPEVQPEAKPEVQPETKPLVQPEAKPETQPSQPAVNADDSTAALAAEVIELVNIERQAEGLEPLQADPLLTQAAGIRAQEILISFSHTRPDGSSCFSALQEVGYRYQRAGENLALGQINAAKAVADWMSSPGHRANILDPRFTHIGVAVQVSPHGGYAWTQFFSD